MYICNIIYIYIYVYIYIYIYIYNVCIGSFSFFINSLTDEVISVFHPKLGKEIDQKFYYFIDTI